MSKALAVGDQAPELAIPDQQGKTVTLESFKGKQVVLYFYPKDDTPGCTKESCDFRDVESQIVRAGRHDRRCEFGWQGVSPEVHQKIRIALSVAQR